MPIAALTDHVAGTVMELATLIGNNQLIEQYLRGEVSASDFTDKISRVYGLPGQNHRVYTQDGSSEGFDGNVPVNYDPMEWGSGYGLPIPPDRDGILDFTHYGKLDDYFPVNPPGPTGNMEITAEQFISNWSWERLGNNPTGDPVGGGAKLVTCADSWHNWLYNAPNPDDDPGVIGFQDARGINGRFPEDLYHDRWMTVPHCAKRIWIPEACNLYVIAMAQGTFNHQLNTAAAEAYDKASSQDFYCDPVFDRSAVFRLFIDKDNDKKSRPFKWRVNGQDFYANWSSIQDLDSRPNVGYGGNNDDVSIQGLMQGMEWSFCNRPRAVARVASRIRVPESGYYNISMRYNSKYWKGVVAEDASGNWEHKKFARSSLDWIDSNGNLSRDEPGPIHIARWEKAQIGAVAHFAPAFTGDING